MTTAWEPATEAFTPWVDENSKPSDGNANGGFDGDFSRMTMGHDDGNSQGGDQKAGYTGCRFCQSLEHKARECPEKPADFGLCFICKEPGHTKAECPNKPPAKCKLCKEEGHDIAECSVNRLFSAYNVEGDMSPADAWANLRAADSERDLDDIKIAVFMYAKSYPQLTIGDLEQVLREAKMNTYIIAKEQTLSVTYTSVNFQGEPDQKFVASFQFSAKPRRAKQDAGWPADAEENTARLAEAGFVMDSFVTVCRNCGETGHISKVCTQDKVEIERIKVECSLCNEEGHRARDCTAPRRVPGRARECRNCGSTEHLAKDCDQAPAARACCNCDSMEHISKDCDQPKDWSRVTCDNCGEKGHGRGRCKAPKKDDEGNDRNHEDDPAADAGYTAANDNGGW